MSGESKEFGKTWEAGDVIGVWADMGGIGRGLGARLGYSLNGVWLGWAAGAGGVLGALCAGHPGASLRPALSLEAGEAVMLNVGLAPFAFPPQSVSETQGPQNA